MKIAKGLRPSPRNVGRSPRVALDAPQYAPPREQQATAKAQTPLGIFLGWVRSSPTAVDREARRTGEAPNGVRPFCPDLAFFLILVRRKPLL